MNVNIDRIRKILKSKEALHVEFKESIEQAKVKEYEHQIDSACLPTVRQGGRQVDPAETGQARTGSRVLR